MFDIRISKVSPDLFNVEVIGNTKTTHSVSLNDDYHDKLTNKGSSKEDLIRRSFEFLLEREGNESILSEFNLKDINKYFPEFEERIR